MRISAEALPKGSHLLRLHESESVEYISTAVLKRLSKERCEVSGLETDNVTKEILLLLFKKCASLGYAECIIKRLKDDRKHTTIYKLKQN